MLVGVVILLLLIGAVAVYFYLQSEKVVPVPQAPGQTSLVPSTSSSSSSSSSPSSSSSSPVVSSLVGKFYADDELTVLHDGKTVYSDNGPWNSLRNLNLSGVKAGDKVVFVVKNTGGPGGLIGSWTWNGKSYDVNTTTFPEFVVSPWNSSSNLTLDRKNLFPGAVWIWSADSCNHCTNQFTWTAA